MTGALSGEFTGEVVKYLCVSLSDKGIFKKYLLFPTHLV